MRLSEDRTLHPPFPQTDSRTMQHQFDWINQEFLQVSSSIPTSVVNCIRAMEWRRNGDLKSCVLPPLPSASRYEMVEEEEEDGDVWVVMTALCWGP